MASKPRDQLKNVRRVRETLALTTISSEIFHLVDNVVDAIGDGEPDWETLVVTVHRDSKLFDHIPDLLRVEASIMVQN